MTDEPHVSTSPLADQRPVPTRVKPRRPYKRAAVAAVARPQPEPQPETPQASSAPPVKRPLFGKRRPTLNLGAVRPGYIPRWINDEPGRIDYAKECGYEHIKDEKGKPRFKVVDRGNGMKAYAMEIPKDLYDEAFFEKQRANDEIDERS